MGDKDGEIAPTGRAVTRHARKARRAASRAMRRPAS